MNLVIDDAVEVRQATKTEVEKRRPLGTMKYIYVHENAANQLYNRPGPPQGRQRLSYPGCLNFRSSFSISICATPCGPSIDHHQPRSHLSASHAPPREYPRRAIGLGEKGQLPWSSVGDKRIVSGITYQGMAFCGSNLSIALGNDHNILYHDQVVEIRGQRPFPASR